VSAVLVVEDEQKVAHALREGLEGEGYLVALEHTGEGAFFRATTETFDVILLDVMLPGRDGLEILTRLRERGLKTPVLVLTARDTLVHDVWNEPVRSAPLDNVIDVHIARLRRKLDVDHPVKLIHTVRGVGFMLREGEPGEA